MIGCDSMASGRKKIFQSVEEIEDKIEQYKQYLEEEGKPPTMAGLAYYLGIDRQTLYNYAKDELFFDTLKRHRDWMMMNIEELCIMARGGGAIFVAKQYGYTDKTTVENTGETQVTIVNNLPSCDDD